jgi:RNA polymerase sigma-70 factor (ECF subfamily)
MNEEPPVHCSAKTAMKLPSTHASLFVPLQQGEHSPEAWAAFHARYHDVILTWCRRRELPSACAEDLTQEIWLKLLRDIHTYKPEKGRLRSWLKAVVNNTLTDYWRRQQAKPERGGIGGSAFLERLAGLASPEAADELSIALERRTDNSAAAILQRVQARLQPATWQAFYQTLVEQRSAKEVAQELGLSVSAVYKHTYRVKQMLQEEYLHVHPDEPGADLPGPDDPESVPG